MTVHWYFVSEEGRFLVDGSIRVNEFFWIFIEHQIMSYVFNFVVEILLILTYDPRSVDQTVSDSPFYVMWVAGLEMQITTSMSRLPVHFRGQFWTPLHNQNVQQWTGIIGSNFYCEFDGSPNAVEMVTKLL
jgi:hypothetical protein